MVVSSISNPELKRYVQYAKDLSRKFSTKYGLPDLEDVESYAVAKLAIILPKLTGENNFGFIQTSLNGYLLNYIRDTYNKNKYPRRICFLKKKYTTIKEEQPPLTDSEISRRLGCSVPDLKTIEDSLYGIYFEDNFRTDSYVDPSLEFILNLSESEYDILSDFNLPFPSLVKKHGPDSPEILFRLLSYLEELNSP